MFVLKATENFADAIMLYKTIIKQLNIADSDIFAHKIRLFGNH